MRWTLPVFSTKTPGRSRVKAKGWAALTRNSKAMVLRVARQRDSMHSVALGAAVGMFLGNIPTLPFQTGAAFFVAWILRINKLAAVAATIVSNPLTNAFFYGVYFFLGSLVISLPPGVFNPENFSLSMLFSAGWRLLLVMTVGGAMFGLPVSFITYGLTLAAMKRFDRKAYLSKLKRRFHLRQDHQDMDEE